MKIKSFIMKNPFNISEKPLNTRPGTCNDGNLAGDNLYSWGHYLYAVGESDISFTGYSGTTEFNTFPLRQLFIKRHNRFPCEWDTGYFRREDIQKYILKNWGHVMSAHYGMNGNDIVKCLLFLNGKNPIYIFIYNRSYQYDPDKFAIALLFIKKTKVVDRLISDFLKFIISEESNIGNLNILIQEQTGFSLQEKKVNCPDIDFNLNYNSDFQNINDLIIDKLSINNSKGLVLLHGAPGTGKTSYIRYLINKINKRIIYIPPNLTNVIADPHLIKFFLEYNNSVLVIEDAENVLMKRSANSSQAIANILNLSDGLLSDCANIQIIATFNSNLLDIDEALLRKGRLIAKYEFKPLAEDRVIKLCEKLGVKVSGDHVLSDIYNSEDVSFCKTKKTVGFKK
jgi:hypothetical protein